MQWRGSFMLLLGVLATTSLIGTSAAKAPSPARKPRIAIVNEKGFHLEVLAGFIDILGKEYADHLSVYMHPFNFAGRKMDFGFVEFLEGYKGRLMGLPTLGFPPHDVVIFVSPEYRIAYVREFIERSKPKLVVFMVHNGDADNVPELLTLHPHGHIMTLSPHVQQFVKDRLGVPVGWMLPLKDVQQRARQCEGEQLNSCLSGFAIQGAMDSRRRNYTHIFDQLDVLVNSSSKYRANMRLGINVVGSGKPERLGVPIHLSQRIFPHKNLRFNDFYEFINTNLALIPALASDSYYDRKFSSTLITSLVTSVPVIVDQRFMDAYSFLEPVHVGMQKKGEEVGDVMQRMLKMASDDLKVTRAAITKLREGLSRKALKILKDLIDPIERELQAEQKDSDAEEEEAEKEQHIRSELASNSLKALQT